MAQPTHLAYTVRDNGKAGKASKSFWTKIGVAFAHGDGKGFDVVLDALPVDGRVSLRVPEPKESTDEAEPE